MAAPLTIIAFDYGLSRIGVAVGQAVTRTATPLTTLHARRGQPDWNAVEALLREWRPARLVVGLPLNMDGTTSEMAEAARAFAARLEGRYSIKTELCDERLSSFEARGLSPDADGRHAVAAQLIAQTYLTATRE